MHSTLGESKKEVVHGKCEKKNTTVKEKKHEETNFLPKHPGQRYNERGV